LIHVLNFYVAAVVMAMGVLSWLVTYAWYFPTIVLGVYLVLFGLIIIVLEIAHVKLLLTIFGFFRWWIGRGIAYVFLGCLCFAFSWWIGFIFFSIGVIVVGVIFIILHFSSLAQPDPLKPGINILGQESYGPPTYDEIDTTDQTRLDVKESAYREGQGYQNDDFGQAQYEIAVPYNNVPVAPSPQTIGVGRPPANPFLD